ncbi:probable 18S rRNA (guanine-N(7))-methyltransferase isoform X1 [Octopus bimaculoides]|uniref:18S rRNA (guanine-N(7))-methyltransferase n=2 Tax=Octopus bimaculoides TaxID=37653 RepID=A0A0L8FU54_OCTBM|nr:probable 18S rRNA (guanine-N(7))-methyltransferase isoform X1 [Octopus bimaculoides]XP_052834210.1 probable 18S rRNA (guanine-N(7))-methyltransferase isoform X1 [Octopus bimaculoides]|eukprot:XP_014786890.1 PREDICTED: probable 18S rRNA (guanine-N(7))-methyltransferase isoform X1 [Octopus bimaculoides]
MAASGRPERQAPPEIFYNETEAQKYTSNSRMIDIQSKLSERAIELLNLPEDQSCYILDVGCGSGLSGECLTEDGHIWVGIDISSAMLDVALERDSDGDFLLGDMGHGMPFRAGTFDGVISISAIQWLCNADKKTHHPVKRLFKFFSSLYACMARGARAVFQLYPENGQQLELITQQAMKAGFLGGVVVDYPNSTKAKKIFLCLFSGGVQQLPKGLGTEESSSADNHIDYISKRERVKQLRKCKNPKKSKDWIQEKKDRRRRQGRDTRPDTKYTGRKRRSQF